MNRLNMEEKFIELYGNEWLLFKKEIEKEEHQRVIEPFEEWHIKFMEDFEPKTDNREIINWWSQILERIEELKQSAGLKSLELSSVDESKLEEQKE